ncbi:helix-turn-helix transcriptional regulator [Parafilimonas sp.]|uniref:helix-turn-helix transcriptional regulator n=1 Tax=Parafilimonas sp. TaxID=1969739 RepID=UPI0039E56897
MAEVFKILSSSNESVDIVPVSSMAKPQPGFIETYTNVGDYGSMLFREVTLSDLKLWISRYIMNYETVFYAEVPGPILEAHITLKNRMVQSLGRRNDTILDNREFNITYAPFMENRALFPVGGEYLTFDIHPKEPVLEKWSKDFPMLDRFLDKKEQKLQHAIQLFGQRSFLDPEMGYVVNKILGHLALPDASRALTEALALELLAMFLLRSQGNNIPAERHHNRHTEALLYARAIIEKEANTFDSEELFSTEIQLAEKVGISLYQFKTGFKRLFGVNPYKMNLELRLYKAQKLLRETGGSVLDIAMKTGFQTREGLIRAYKRLFKITPTMERPK